MRVAGYVLRVAICGLWVSGSEMRIASCEIRLVDCEGLTHGAEGIAQTEEFGRRNGECGLRPIGACAYAPVGSQKRQSPWTQVTRLLKNQSFKPYALYPLPSARCFIIPNSHFPLPPSPFRIPTFPLPPSAFPSSLYKPVFWCYFASTLYGGEENTITNIRSRKWSTSKYDF